MANWSQSHFLQSLGWATLNSFWQMALLWCIYLGGISLFKVSSHKKYQFSVIAIAAGFLWFAFTFFYYYQSNSVSTIGLFNQTINESNSTLNIFLLSASLAYLSLLIFPSYRLFRNWQFVQKIKKEGLQKADLNYRLFVQKVAAHLGIRKKVFVYLSELVSSPVTIGYFKPIILLPLAALNNLSTQQVEAILLHELSHIRRYDYLVNFMISIISTLLYFNPFMKQFMKNIEEERENCCDQLVLQFGYDKVSYASALLTLEKLSAHHPVLAMGAAGRNYLLSRIEKIVGMEKKKGFRLNHFAAILAALFCIVVFNSVLIIREKKNTVSLLAYSDVVNPFGFFDSETSSNGSLPYRTIKDRKEFVATAAAKGKPGTIEINVNNELNGNEEAPAPTEPANPFINVAADEIDASLTKEEKAEVKKAVEGTKKVLNNLQWKQVETAIADVMTEKEKVQARKLYLKEFEKTVNWNNVEQNLKAQYDNTDWTRINTNINNALTIIQLDSIQKCYNAMLCQLDKSKAEATAKARISVTPLPDQSLREVQQTQEELRRRIDTLKALRNPKKVISL
jgi:bla regulator protein BlaR1